MKSINKFLVVMLCFVLFTTMAFALSACIEKELKITKIEVNGPSETTVGEFDYNDYTVKLIFDDGSTKDIKLNEDLLSASDRELLDTPGTHTITVQYNDVTCTFTVTIKGDGESQDKGIKSIAISGPNEIVAGNIDYNDFSLVITYEDDSTTTIELREEFILEEDRAKLNTVGSHSISITYNGTTTTWNITVKENESTGDNIFEGVTFEDATYTYDGREKSIEVKGVPDGATVRYNVSNSYTNAGVYPIEATISKEGYKTLVLTATLTINKATYDISGVEFVDKTVVYNGEVQRIEISGSLPQGVTVTYENNDKTDVGTYEVVAKFTGDSNNYEAIADMTATLTIKEAKETEGLIFEKINNDTEYSVVGYEGSESDVVIMATHEGLPVTTIRYRAFYDCTGLTSITIPDSVTSIGDYAFSYCSGLTSITIPDGVTSIGDYAFSYCSGLTSITIPNSVTSIGRSVFYNCSGLTSITIPDSVTSIGSYAFYGCSGLTSITIPDSVTSIGSSAFWGCSGLTSITIPDSVTSIEHNTFLYCSGLESITIPDSVKSIGLGAFSGCSGLTSITIGNGVTSIGNSAFSGCSGLTSITVAEGNSKYHSQDNCIIETASKTLIAGCKTSIIPDDGSVTSIGNQAFYNCSGLTSITIPDSVTSIGGHAFYGCSGLTSIIIPDSVTSIEWYAFYGCSGLASVTIPNGVTSIGESTFLGCSGLTSITIPDSVTSIVSKAFSGCSGLTSITVAEGNSKYHSQDNCIIETASKTLIVGCKTSIIPDDGSVTSIKGYAFSDCSGLTSITIPDSVTSIGYEAFRGCSGLTSITVAEGNSKYHSQDNCIIETASKTLIAGCKTSIIPDDGSVTSIGWYAFEGCSGLTSITIPDSVTSIGSYSFRDCSGLTSITIPDSVTSIGSQAFYNCSGLKSVTIGNSVTSIGGQVFYNCSGLKSVTIGNSVTSIGGNAFYNCSGLTSITIPESVTIIEDWAFLGCSNLTNVTFENTQGWRYSSSSSAMSGTSISSSDLEDPVIAAKYLTTTYRSYYWKRSSR